MQLETVRLHIRALNKQELLKYILYDHSLEVVLNLNERKRYVTEKIKKSIEDKIIPEINANPANYLFYTFWNIINKKQRLMVGDICFKGLPNEKGEVEIGYGTYKDFQNNGFMTEAIGEIVSWAFKQDKVRKIIAYTDPNNIASNKVLKKNKFRTQNQTTKTVYWYLDKIDNDKRK
ncbi:GNAT family N-acetyltransferase [Ulvibacter antarcticus]|uniref:RimJ/RimL family protein N-acetyltransferase n=1 Tax=Ulvibacter antarcticus TaxID=442714 RepID=A0A3L9YAF5_9FLAO|nr:GNAT family N-acetyltransferase [Ulvibacter antarcticus]RMA56280.1 RimJ/RimL family protein N-acetyltransferase [Ulvibacter antarcticus]